MPSHTARRPRVDASVVTTTRDVTKPRGTPRALMLLPETAMHKRSEVHTVQGTRDFSQNCSGCICSKLPSLKWHREDKMAHLHHFLLEAHSQIHYRLTRGENALMHIHTCPQELQAKKQFVYMAGWHVP